MYWLNRFHNDFYSDVLISKGTMDTLSSLGYIFAVRMKSGVKVVVKAPGVTGFTPTFPFFWMRR